VRRITVFLATNKKGTEGVSAYSNHNLHEGPISNGAATLQLRVSGAFVPVLPKKNF
jgi:hypothetical protein